MSACLVEQLLGVGERLAAAGAKVENDIALFEMIGKLDYDSYTIDLQHSLIDRGTLALCVTPAPGSSGAVGGQLLMVDRARLRHVEHAPAGVVQ